MVFKKIMCDQVDQAIMQAAGLLVYYSFIIAIALTGEPSAFSTFRGKH